jgi:DNA-binding MarR family transcriptional regulator
LSTVLSRSSGLGWSFLTNHARVLLCIANDPGVRLREIGDAVGITERAAHRIVTELADAGYISRARVGRREQRIGDLLALLERGGSRADRAD